MCDEGALAAMMCSMRMSEFQKNPTGDSLDSLLSDVQHLLEEVGKSDVGMSPALVAAFTGVAQQMLRCLIELNISTVTRPQKLLRLLVCLSPCLDEQQHLTILRFVFASYPHPLSFMALLAEVELNADSIQTYLDVVQVILKCPGAEVRADGYYEKLCVCVGDALHRGWQRNGLLRCAELVSRLTSTLLKPRPVPEVASWLLSTLIDYFSFTTGQHSNRPDGHEPTFDERMLFACAVVHVLCGADHLDAMDNGTVSALTRAVRNGLVCNDANTRRHSRAIIAVLHAKHDARTPFGVGHEWQNFLTVLEMLENKQSHLLLPSLSLFSKLRNASGTATNCGGEKSRFPQDWLFVVLEVAQSCSQPAVIVRIFEQMFQNGEDALVEAGVHSGDFPFSRLLPSLNNVQLFCYLRSLGRLSHFVDRLIAFLQGCYDYWKLQFLKECLSLIVTSFWDPVSAFCFVYALSSLDAITATSCPALIDSFCSVFTRVKILPPFERAMIQLRMIVLLRKVIVFDFAGLLKFASVILPTLPAYLTSDSVPNWRALRILISAFMENTAPELIISNFNPDNAESLAALLSMCSSSYREEVFGAICDRMPSTLCQLPVAETMFMDSLITVGSLLASSAGGLSHTVCRWWVQTFDSFMQKRFSGDSQSDIRLAERYACFHTWLESRNDGERRSDDAYHYFCEIFSSSGRPVESRIIAGLISSFLPQSRQQRLSTFSPLTRMFSKWYSSFCNAVSSRRAGLFDGKHISEFYARLWTAFNEAFLTADWNLLRQASDYEHLLENCLNSFDLVNANDVSILLDTIKLLLPKSHLDEPAVVNLIETCESYTFQGSEAVGFHYSLRTLLNIAYWAALKFAEGSDCVLRTAIKTSRRILTMTSSPSAMFLLCEKLYELTYGSTALLKKREILSLLIGLFTFSSRSDEASRLSAFVRWHGFNADDLGYIESHAPSSYTWTWRIRVRAAAALLRVAESSADGATVVLDVFLEEVSSLTRSISGQRLYPDSPQMMQLMRYLQLALLLQPYIGLEETASKFVSMCEQWLQRAIQPSVKIFFEWLASRIIVRFPSFFTHWLEMEYEFSRRRIGSINSWMAVYLRAVAVQMESEPRFFTTRMVQDLIDFLSRVIKWTSTQNVAVRCYSKAVLIVAAKKVSERLMAAGHNEFVSVLEQCSACETEQRNEHRQVERLSSSFFMSSFHVVDHYSVQMLLETVPTLTRVSCVDILAWSDPLFSELQTVFEKDFCRIPWLSSGNFPLQRYETSQEELTDSAEDDGLARNFQVKGDRPSAFSRFAADGLLAPAAFETELTDCNQTRKSPLIVVASLVEKAANLGGLCRTCEVFGVCRFVVANARALESRDFTSLSMSAENWLQIAEVKPHQLKEYLTAVKQRGYEVVGVEQTMGSTDLDRFQFKRNTVLLLGNEKKGIPFDVLQVLDTCVSVPQFGYVASLNVHVAGALALWKYVEQHLVLKKETSRLRNDQCHWDGVQRPEHRCEVME